MEKRPPPTPDVPPPGELPAIEHYADLFYFEEFCRDCLVIIDKRNRRVPFLLNSTQRKILAELRRLIAAGIPPRLLILKARQVGISTLIEALLFWACLTQPNRSSLVIAHKMKSSKTLFRMTRNFHRFLPDSMRQRRRLENVSEIEFDSGSRLEVEVQGDPRGYAAQGVHVSEAAFFTELEVTLTSVMQTLPYSTESLCAIESTANGVGNKFHKLWQRASGLALDEQVPEDERGWTPIFIPWFEHEEYRIPLDGKALTITAEEARFMRLHNITLEQMKWRRWCISTNLDGDEDLFAQEYPATPEEAFALSGRPAFDVQAVQHYTKQIADAVREKRLPVRMEIESDPPGIGSVDIVEHERGRLRIFGYPKDRHTYIVGADPSEGDPGSDPSPLAVLCQQTLDLEATWYGKAPPDVLACHAIDLARYYNDALVINEANNHGILFHETVLQLGYPNLYYRKVSEESVAGKITEKPGYLSTRRNREHLFNTLRKYVRMRMGRLPCPHFVQQMQSLVYIENKAEAQAGSEKDLLISFALCLMAHRGSMANPLEPLPDAVIRSVATEAALLRERDPAAAAASCGRLGMTQDAVDRAEEAILARELSQRRYGLGGMR